MRESGSQGSNLGKPRYAPQTFDIPLLPYERDLIKAVGLSTQEYLFYRNKVLTAKFNREGYEHIPDVQGAVVPIVASLVIGLALTAAASLFNTNEKPKAEEQEERKSAELSSNVGRSRFNETVGIDSQQEVVSIGAAVPILFGRYAQQGSKNTGGIFAPCQLVWSRMFSDGTSQRFKGLYVIGEALGQSKADIPSVENFYIGQAVIDAFPKEQIALYWAQGRPSTAEKRAPNNSDWSPSQSLIYGTRAFPAAADPEKGTRNDPFMCPIQKLGDGPGYSQSISQINNAEFGAYGTLHNGVSFKLNFEIISLDPELDDDAIQIIEQRRLRIVGSKSNNLDDGQSGLGRGYAPLMGVRKIIKASGQVIQPDRPLKAFDELVSVGPGDELEYYIHKRTPQRDGSEPAYDIDEKTIDIAEIHNRTNALREKADNLLQVGQLVMCGRTVWQVTSREAGSVGIWEPDVLKEDDSLGIADQGQAVTIRLKYVESTTFEGATKIGIPGTQLQEGSSNIPKVITSEGENNFSNQWLGTAFFGFSAFKFATYRNSRPVDVTEIGLESVVYNRGNGLCNFSSLLTPSELEDYDEERIQVRSGTQSQYFDRTSVFVLQCRPTGGEYEWENMGEQFAVTGNTPQKMFNYIRIAHTQRSQMEFRLVPKLCADIKYFGPEAEVMQLDSANGSLVGNQFTSQKGYGVFYMSSTGRFIRIDTKRGNVEMQSKGGKTRTRTTNKALSADIVMLLPTNQTKGRAQAFYHDVLGDASSKKVGTVKEAWVDVDQVGSRAQIKLKCRVDKVDWVNFIEWYGTDKSWTVIEFSQIRNGEDLSEFFTVTRRVRNRFSAKWGYSDQKVGYEMRVTKYQTVTVEGGVEADRDFEAYSQLAEISHYAELEKSCDDGPEHRISYINESLSPSEVQSDDDVWSKAADFSNMQTVGLSIRSNNQLSTLNQLRVWLPNGVPCEQLAEGGKIGGSNLFSDAAYWLLTNDVGGIGAVAEEDWIDEKSFIETSKYLKCNGIYFDGALQNKRNLRAFLAEQAPLNICAFTIGNGKMALQPALPTTEANVIDAKNPIKVKHYFNEGNIIDESYTASYLDASERSLFRAVVIWREATKNNQSIKNSVLIRWNEDWTDPNTGEKLVFSGKPERAPQETFDLSQWVTSRKQAEMIGRYLLSIRYRVTHAIQFTTTPYGVSVAPNDYIKLDVSESVTQPYGVGVVSPTGEILSSRILEDGEHELVMYLQGADDVEKRTVRIADGRIEGEEYYGSVYSSLIPDSTQAIYQISQVQIGEDGLLQIDANHVPTDKNGASIVAQDVLDTTGSLNTGRFFYRV